MFNTIFNTPNKNPFETGLLRLFQKVRFLFEAPKSKRPIFRRSDKSSDREAILRNSGGKWVFFLCGNYGGKWAFSINSTRNISCGLIAILLNDCQGSSGYSHG